MTQALLLCGAAAIGRHASGGATDVAIAQITGWPVPTSAVGGEQQREKRKGEHNDAGNARSRPPGDAGRYGAGNDDGSQSQPMAQHSADRQSDQDGDDIHQSDDDEMGETHIVRFVSGKVVVFSRCIFDLAVIGHQSLQLARPGVVSV